MTHIRKIIRRIFCFHGDPRLWKHVRNLFVHDLWETREEWQCGCCGKTKLFKHLNKA